MGPSPSDVVSQQLIGGFWRVVNFLHYWLQELFIYVVFHLMEYYDVIPLEEICLKAAYLSSFLSSRALTRKLIHLDSIHQKFVHFRGHDGLWLGFLDDLHCWVARPFLFLLLGWLSICLILLQKFNCIMGSLWTVSLSIIFLQLLRGIRQDLLVPQPDFAALGFLGILTWFLLRRWTISGYVSL